MQERCELLGITTVTGEAEKRAQIAYSIISVVDKKIPIYPDEENPFYIEQKQKVAPQSIGPSIEEKNNKICKAIDFMKEVIEKNPGEVILLCIAPFTNIATLFKKYPDVSSFIKRYFTYNKFSIFCIIFLYIK